MNAITWDVFFILFNFSKAKLNHAIYILQLRLKKEQEEKEHNKKEGHMYTVIKIAHYKDLIKQIGTEIYFDLVDHEKVHCFHVNNWMRFCTFKEEVAKQFGIPVQFQRFWLWEKRQNHTYRPSRPLTPEEEIQSVGQLRELSKEAYSAELKLFLEVELGPVMAQLDSHPIPLSGKTNDHILLFFKLYDAENKLLSYVGNMIVKISGCPSEILIKLNKMAKFSPSQEIELYKEIKYEPIVVCEQIDPTSTFQACELKDGDIVCYQKSSVVGEQYNYPDVPSFLKYQLNCQVQLFLFIESCICDLSSFLVSKVGVFDLVTSICVYFQVIYHC
ncbi:ubiquitinyl hydrolase 1 [Ranunculus cassubicifolius]